MNLITDRTWEDVAQGNSKGYYNASDLLRVENAAYELSKLYRNLSNLLRAYAANLGVDLTEALDIDYDVSLVKNLTFKRDWASTDTLSTEELATGSDIPTRDDMERYLSNVRAFQKMLGTSYDLPSSMRFLTIEGANAIEEVLAYADRYYTTYKESKEKVIDKVPLSWCYSGDVFAGEMAIVGVPQKLIFFTIDDGGSSSETFSVSPGTTWEEWVGPVRLIFNNSLELYIYGGVVATEAGVYAVSLDGNTAVSGGDEIVSGATYTIINWGG